MPPSEVALASSDCPDNQPIEPSVEYDRPDSSPCPWACNNGRAIPVGWPASIGAGSLGVPRRSCL